MGFHRDPLACLLAGRVCFCHRALTTGSQQRQKEEGVTLLGPLLWASNSHFSREGTLQARCHWVPPRRLAANASGSNL